MENRRLTSDIVSIIHHIKLNEVGWWETSLKRIVLIVLWIDNKKNNLNQVRERIRENLGLEVELSVLEQQVDELFEERKVNKVDGDYFVIADNASKEIQENLKSTEQLNENVKKKFYSLIDDTECITDPENLWEKFNDDLIIPSVKEMGAQLFQLLARENLTIDRFFGFTQFMEQFPANQQCPIKEKLLAFLTSDDEEITRYILSFLRSYFILESGKLGRDTVTSLYQSMEEKPTLTIFVDTNFLFSVLGIHNNPSDDDAETLLNLLNKLRKDFNIKLYVLPITLEETRKAIQWRVDRAANITIGPNLSSATLDSEEISGFLRKLSNEVRKTGQRLNVKEFYGPYITNLLDIVRSKGIELFNCDLTHYDSDEQTLADISEQYDFEESHYGDKAKRYEAIKHDMVLWHFVNDKRTKLRESPIDVKYWIVTVDFHFLRFDNYKRASSNEEYPITLQPSTITQMLQFWVPRTEEFEDIIYRSWLSPLFFEEFDAESESLTMTILEVLSRYENIDDLPPEVVRNIFLDKAIRQRLQDGVNHTEEEIKHFIDETIIRETRKLAEQVKQKQEESESKDKVINNQNKNLDEKEKLLSEKNSEIEHLISKLDKREKDLTLAQEEINNIKLDKEKRKFVFKNFSLPVIIISLLLILSIIIVSRFTDYKFPIILSTFWISIYILISSAILKYVIKKSDLDLEIEKEKYINVRKWLFGVLLFSLGIELLASSFVNEYQSIMDLLK